MRLNQSLQQNYRYPKDRAIVRSAYLLTECLLMPLVEEIKNIATAGSGAACALAQLSADIKCTILRAIAEGIAAAAPTILQANEEDLVDARASNLSPTLLDRLLLNERRIAAITKAVEQVATLPDPVGRVLARIQRPNGLEITKQAVPIGLIAIIYEARPNVTVDAAVLCLKSGNAVVLRGGSEALRTNRALVAALRNSGARAGLPKDAVQLIETTDRAAVRELVQLEGLVDLAIPRGGEGLIRAVTEMARVPVIKHYKGVCHVYIDYHADLQVASHITINAKCQRPGVCNAIETLVVHQAVAAEILPHLASELSKRGVELRGDSQACLLVPTMRQATEEDWYAEYLDLILAVRVVPSLEVAVEHINHYGSHHSDAIITSDNTAGEWFLNNVNSACVYLNASTRFTDGGEFGMGAEIGISTDKIHARGPMGLEELTTYKYLVRGTGQVRE